MTRAVSRAVPAPPLLERGLFAGLGVVAIMAPLVPISHAADRAAMPDLLYCLVIAWVIRRPASAPLGLVLGLGLFADILLNRPLGLGALGLVLASEVVRARRGVLQGGFFLPEWLAAAAAFAAILAGAYLMLALVFVAGPGIGPLAQHWVATALAYPVVALTLHWGLGLGGGRP